MGSDGANRTRIRKRTLYAQRFEIQAIQFYGAVFHYGRQSYKRLGFGDCSPDIPLERQAGVQADLKQLGLVVRVYWGCFEARNFLTCENFWSQTEQSIDLHGGSIPSAEGIGHVPGTDDKVFVQPEGLSPALDA